MMIVVGDGSGVWWVLGVGWCVVGGVWCVVCGGWWMPYVDTIYLQRSVGRGGIERLWGRSVGRHW